MWLLLSCLHPSSKLYNSKMQDFDVSWTPMHIFGLHWCYASNRWVYGCSVVGSHCRGICRWLVAYPSCATYPRYFKVLCRFGNTVPSQQEWPVVKSKEKIKCIGYMIKLSISSNENFWPIKILFFSHQTHRL